MKLAHPVPRQSTLHLKIVRPAVTTTATPPRSKFLVLLAGWADAARTLCSGVLTAFALPEHPHRARAHQLLQATNLWAIRLRP